MYLTNDRRNQLKTSQCNVEILMAKTYQDDLNISIIVHNWQVLICDKLHDHSPSQATYRAAATIGQERSRSAQWALLNLQQKQRCLCTGSGKSSLKKTKGYTTLLMQFKIAHEKGTSQKKSTLPTIISQGLCWFSRVYDTMTSLLLLDWPS